MNLSVLETHPPIRRRHGVDWTAPYAAFAKTHRWRRPVEVKKVISERDRASGPVNGAAVVGTTGRR